LNLDIGICLGFRPLSFGFSLWGIIAGLFYLSLRAKRSNPRNSSPLTGED
jgi:hypothetical protein